MIRHQAKVAIPQSQMMVLYACLKCEMEIYLANVISGHPPVWDLQNEETQQSQGLQKRIE